MHSMYGMLLCFQDVSFLLQDDTFPVTSTRTVIFCNEFYPEQLHMGALSIKIHIFRIKRQCTYLNDK